MKTQDLYEAYNKGKNIGFDEIRLLCFDGFFFEVENAHNGYYNIFWCFSEDIWEQRLDKDFYSNINKNKEIIEVINYNIHSELKSFNYDNSTDLSDISDPEKYDIHVIGRDAVLFIHTLKKYFHPNLNIDYTIDPEDLQDRKDRRQSSNRPTNNERLKSLKEFCPELISKLIKSELNKDEKGQVINLITGVNITDAYKKTMTADIKELDNTIIKNDEIDLKELKNKLNNI